MKKLVIYALPILLGIMVSCSNEDMIPNAEIEEVVDSENLLDIEGMERMIREMISKKLEFEPLPMHIVDINGEIILTVYRNGLGSNSFEPRITDIESQKEMKLIDGASNRHLEVLGLTQAEQQLMNITTTIVNQAFEEVNLVFIWLGKVITRLQRYLERPSNGECNCYGD